jgi:hypothetical protein
VRKISGKCQSRTDSVRSIAVSFLEEIRKTTSRPQISASGFHFRQAEKAEGVMKTDSSHVLPDVLMSQSMSVAVTKQNTVYLVIMGKILTGWSKKKYINDYF